MTGSETHRPTVAEREMLGREARKLAPRSSHADWAPAGDRPDAVELLRAQDDDRMVDLVPIRWGRMSASPFAFYRGSAALEAAEDRAAEDAQPHRGNVVSMPSWRR